MFSHSVVMVQKGPGISPFFSPNRLYKPKCALFKIRMRSGGVKLRLLELKSSNVQSKLKN